MYKHTPWKAVHQSSCPSFWWVANAWGKKVCGLSHSVPDDDKEAIANLIAAAPDLLDACEELVDLVEDIISGAYKPDCLTTQPARAAIAKSKGESNA